MLKLFRLGFILFISIGALAQGPTVLDVYTSPDGAFQFSYPDNYVLLVGERMLTATQGRNLGFPVCDFSSSWVCLIYPIEKLDNYKIEAAGFSVDVISPITSESECLAYADRIARPTNNDEHSQPSSFTINGRVFRHVSAEKRMSGHAQSSDSYRTFLKNRCYELRIAVSFTDESSGQQRSPSKSMEAAEADDVRRSFKLVLSTFVFAQ